MAKLRSRGEFKFMSSTIIVLLMTKFGKAGKTRQSGLPNRCIRFWQFQSQTMEEAKLVDLKIQGVLKPEKGLKGIKGTR
jgi:hypothetical protein